MYLRDCTNTQMYNAILRTMYRYICSLIPRPLRGGGGGGRPGNKAIVHMYIHVYTCTCKPDLICLPLCQIIRTLIRHVCYRCYRWPLQPIRDKNIPLVQICCIDSVSLYSPILCQRQSPQYGYSLYICCYSVY